MVRAPSIRARPTPARKTVSSSYSTISTSTLPLGAKKIAIPKALKRAEKRAKLLARAPDTDNAGARALLKDGEDRISKSSIRRRKRKARDEIGKDVDQGREGGVKEIKEIIDDLDIEIQAVEENKVTHMKQKNVFESGKMTANQRRKMLAQEQARQNVILSDAAYKASPFEALRIHARNTIAGSR